MPKHKGGFNRDKGDTGDGKSWYGGMGVSEKELKRLDKATMDRRWNSDIGLFLSLHPALCTLH